jgi:hypothetical protein
MSYQVSVHLAEVSEEKIKMRKVNGQQMQSDGKSSHCLWQGEHRNMAGSIYGMSSMNNAHFVSIG